MAENTPSCWIVTDGKAGMENQCLGLAEAAGLQPHVIRVALRRPWRDLAPHLRLGLRHAFVGEPLVPPWPDLLIATGRQSVPASLLVRRCSVRTTRVQIQNPGVSPRNFDLVITPVHDELWGVNVIQTIGALHRVTPGRLEEGMRTLAPLLSNFRRPFLGALIGGPNAAYRFGPEEARVLALQLVRHANELGASLLITASRRTGEETVSTLRAALAGTPAFFWDGTGVNPYYGILALADVIVVTADSVNMITESCATGRSVYIYGLPGGSKKASRFIEALLLRGYARLYSGTLGIFAANRLQEMERVARAVLQLLNDNRDCGLRNRRQFPVRHPHSSHGYPNGLPRA